MTEQKLTKTAVEDLLRGGAIGDSIISEMNCRELTWGAVSISNTVFENVHLGDADLRANTWCEVSLRNVVMRGIKAPYALSKSNFHGVDLIESSWVNSRLEDSSWKESNLSNALFEGAVLNRCEFQSADLARVSGKGMLWTGGGASDEGLGGANLMGANLSDALLCAVSLRGANLCGADLSNSLFLGVDLSGAELAGASLDNAVWIGCRTDGIQWEENDARPDQKGERLRERLSLVEDRHLVDVLLYLLTSGALLMTGGSVNPGTSLPIPPQYYSASYETIVEALKMRLPHPQWSSREKDATVGLKETLVGSPEVEQSSSGVEASSPPVQDDGESCDGGRFSLLEID